MNLTTLILADDHQLVRQGLRTLLEGQADFRVVAETADGREVVPLVERLKPHVLVVDLSMPGLGGLEISRQVTRYVPTTRVVLLTMHSNEAYVLEAIRAGALAYVLKEADAEELVLAIREAAAGRRYLSAPLSDRAIEAYLKKAEAGVVDPYQALTTREREVLQLSAEGHSNPAIAERLYISPRTVETHRAHLMRKLDLRTQTDLVRYALRRGLVPMEE